MKRTIETKVIGSENEDGENPRAILQCPEGETMAGNAIATAGPIVVDQERVGFRDKSHQRRWKRQIDRSAG
jgi:hypothetical protein